MSKGQKLRVLVNARLCAAAEEIFALFESTIAEYEEELCRSKEKERNQELLLDSVLCPSAAPLRPGVEAQTDPGRPGPGLSVDRGLDQGLGLGLDQGLGLGLDLGLTDLRVKEEPEEQRVKQEEDQLHEPVPESGSVCVKSEEFSLLQQRQTELKDEETRGDDIDTEPHLQPETVSFDTDAVWSAPFGCPSDARVETQANRDRHHHRGDQNSALYADLFLKHKSEPETSAAADDAQVSGAAEGGEKNRFQCSICERTFGAKYTLQVHFRVHTGERPYVCSICNRTFADKSNLRKHKISHAKRAQFRCSLCRKSFVSKYSLDIHIENSHTDTKAFSCSTCTKGFGSHDELAEHTKTHAAAKPYSCSVCERSFFHKCNLQTHMRIHTREAKFSCAVCGKAFVNKKSLYAHGRTDHKVKKSFGCAFCEKTFGNKYSLDVHAKNYHTGENTFVCKECETTFASYYALVKHRATHTGAKPYSCSFCEKTFIQRGDLNVHVRTHTGERPYSCTVCKKSFAYRKTLNRHILVCNVFGQKRDLRINGCSKAKGIRAAMNDFFADQFMLDAAGEQEKILNLKTSI